MSFTTSGNKKVLKRLSVAEGGGFVNFASNINRAEITDNKILIIGVGGMGGKTLTRIKSEIYKKFEIPEGKEKPDNVEFLYLDSDREELSKACNKDINGIGLNSGETCQIYDPGAGAIFKEYDWYSKLKDYQKQWYNPSLSPVLSGNGAGAIRQAARYLITSGGAFGRIVENISKKLDAIMEKNIVQGTSIRVFLVAGLGGGTGSGSFIDLAYIIREIVKQKQWSPIFKLMGCLYLPDVYELNGPAKEKAMENGYAALKELDYFMNMENLEDARFNMKYSSSFEITQSKVNIFDNCVLMTGTKDGIGSMVHSQEKAIDTVCDFIIDIVTKTDKIDGKFLLESLLDDEEAHKDVTLNRLSGSNVPMNANYSYMVIGCSSVLLPFEQITCYLGYKTMKRIYDLWNKEPDSSEINTTLDKLEVNVQRQFNRITHSAQTNYKTMITEDFTKSDLMNGEIDVRMENQIRSQNDLVLNSCEKVRQKLSQEITINFNQTIETSIKDINRGPNYIYKSIGGFLRDGRENVTGMVDIVKHDYKRTLKSEKTKCLSMIQDMEQQKQQIKRKMGGFGSKKKKVQEYTELCYKIEVTRNRDLYIYDKIDNTLDTFIENMNNISANYLKGYKETMEEIMKILKQNYDLVMDSEKSESIFHNSLVNLSSNEGDDKRLKMILDRMIDEKTDAELFDEFAKVILENSREWTSTDPNIYNPGRSIVLFIEKLYEPILGKSVEDFLKDYKEQEFEQEVTNICQRLKVGSDASFQTQLDFQLEYFTSHKFVAIPQNATEFKNQIENMKDGSKPFNSSDKNKINWIKCYASIPLFAMCNIEEYEKNYHKSKGAHLNEYTDNYGDLPSLHNKKYYSENYTNLDEKAICDDISNSIDEMIEEGLVFKTDNEYITRVIYDYKKSDDSIDEDIKRFVDKYKNDDKNKEGMVFKENLNLLEKFAECYDLKIYNKLIKPKDSHLTNSLEDLKKATRMNWHLYKNMKSNLELYKKIKSYIDDLNKEIIEKENEKEGEIIATKQFEEDTDLFKRCLDTELIFKEGNFWRYYTNIDEKLTFAKCLTFTKFERDYELFTCFKAFIDTLEDNHRLVLRRLYERKIDDPNPEIADTVIKIKNAIEEEATEKINYLKSFEAEMDFLSKGSEDVRKELQKFYSRILEL